MPDKVYDSMPSRHTRYENLVHAYSPWLYRYAYWLCGEKGAAEDLVQETFLRAWRFLDSLQNEAAAKGWLTTILRRENARKYEKKQLQYTETDLETLPTQQVDIDQRPEVLALRNALWKLPAKYREPLILQVIEGYSLAEIADMFDLPRNTVATRLHRARQKLRNQLTTDREGSNNHELS